MREPGCEDSIFCHLQARRTLGVCVFDMLPSGIFSCAQDSWGGRMVVLPGNGVGLTIVNYILITGLACSPSLAIGGMEV